MRSIVVILVSVLLLVGGFFIYFWLGGGRSAAPVGQPIAQRSPQLAATRPATPAPVEGVVAGAGEDVWVQTLDEKTGEVAFQFRASRYDPEPDVVKVTNPQAELFLGSGRRQVVRIEGASGEVVMATDVAQRGQIRSREAAAPRRGIIRDVTIRLFDEADLSRPVLVCRVNNIAFDNDTFRIATEGYDEPDGTHVPAEQVRVEVRGDDVDFDGRGLTIRWNELDRRLQLLEIAHGERMLIKSPQVLQTLQQGRVRGDARAAANDGDEPPAVPASYQPEMNRDVGAAADTGESGDRAMRRDAPVYRANFLEQVRITQDGEPIAAADQMHVDFISAADEPISTRRPRPGAEASPPAPAPRDPAPGAPAEPAPAPAPLVLTWTGKFRVSALDGDAPRPAPGSLNIAMSADPQPVLLNYRGMELACAAFDYRSGDDSLSVTSSPAVPLIMLRTSDGTVVNTPSIVYSGTDSLATLRGEGRAHIPVQSAPDAAAQVMQARWHDRCVFTLLRTSAGDLSVDRALLEGNVNIIHPEFALRSDTLDLGLQPGTGDQLEVDEIKADGAVHCRFTDSDGAKHDIRCDHLSARPQGADGQRVQVIADGNVHAVGDDHDLRAGRLTIISARAAAEAAARDAAEQQGEPRPSAMFAGGDFTVESISAQTDVKLVLPDGGSATADQVQLSMSQAGTSAELLGQPAAVLSDGRSTLRGPHIRYEQASAQLRVHGPGSLSAALDANDAGQRARPVELEWQSGLSFDGSANVAEISGDSRVRSTEADGTELTMSADRFVLVLEDEKVSDDTSAAAARSKSDGHDAADVRYFDLMQGKAWRSVTLVGSARVQSLLMGGEPSHFRRMILLAPRVQYDLQTGHAVVPSAGQILIQNTLVPAGGEEVRPAPQLLGGGRARGATAVQWQEKLEFLPDSKQVILTGGVTVVHQETGASTPTMRLESGRAVMQLRPRDNASADGMPAEAARDGLFDMSGLELEGLSADGGVRVMLPQLSLDSAEASYDAREQLLTARGTPRQPVQLYDEQGLSGGSFLEVVWNARTEQVQRLRDVQAQIRP